jgi:hypothetical protein
MISDNFPRPYPSQFDLRGESVNCYGSDFRKCITYKFNNQGFRSDFDFDINTRDSLLICLGSSIGTAHGLDLTQGFGYLTANHFNKTLWNLGQGCFRSSNQTMMEQVDFLSQTKLNIDYYVIQFTHINRMGNKSNSYLELDEKLSVDNFVNILKRISTRLKNKKWCWLMCDYSDVEFPEYVINHPNKIAINPDSVDHVDVENYRNLAPTEQVFKTLSLHPGLEWNRTIAKMIIEYFDEHQQPLA